MRLPIILRLFLCILVFSCAVQAEPAPPPTDLAAGDNVVITLKSGEKIEGKVTIGGKDSFEIEYKLTPKIKDRKTLQKSDVVEVIKKRPSEIEYLERGLGKLTPTPDLRDAAYYESTIQDVLRPFVAKYPGTPEAEEVEKTIALFAEKKNKVLAGQAKVEGRWLDAAAVKRDSYNIEAYRQYLTMKERAAENKLNRYLDALRAFDKLQNDYSVSPYYLKAIPEAQEIMKKFEIQLGSMIKDAPILIQRREDGLRQLTPTEAAASKRAIDEETHRYEETLKSQAATKVKWHDMSTFDPKGLEDLVAMIAKERAQLAALDLEAMRTEAETLMTVIRYVADKNITEATAALERASKIPKPVNVALITKLKNDIELLKQNEINEQKNRPVEVKPMPETPPADPGTKPVNPVAESLKKAQEQQAKPEKTPDANTPPAGSSTTPKPAAPAPAQPAAPEPESGLMGTVNEFLPLVGVALLAMIGLVWYSKKKKKAQE